tara:strand:- start:76 stop:561 length:486 start_codon:yes stop_codon:yes gene_type:complete
MASRGIDFLITYRVVKLLVTPFEKQEAFKTGIIDKDGKVLKKYKTLKTEKERKSYTLLHRFVFNLKRILKKVGLGSKLGSFAVALALLIREDKRYAEHQPLIERTIIKYLKENNLYEEVMMEETEIPTFEPEEQVFCNCFGVDVYEKDGELISEYEYAKTL